MWSPSSRSPAGGDAGVSGVADGAGEAGAVSTWGAGGGWRRRLSFILVPRQKLWWISSSSRALSVKILISCLSLSSSTSTPLAKIRIRNSGALHVLTRAGIDLQNFPLIDEERHHDHGAGFQSRGLDPSGGRIAFHAGLGVNNLEVDEIG